MSGVLEHVNLHLVRTLDDAMAFKRWLAQRRRILGVDTETGGFGPERNRLRLIQFGDLDTGWAIPWERWSGIAVEALQEYDGAIVLHNAKFDARFITHHAPELDWPWHRMHDTMSMAHLLNPLRPKGLKPLSAMLVDPKAALAQRLLDEGMKDNKWTWDTVPLSYQYYWVYAAMDPVLTCHIYEKLADQITSEFQPSYDLELAATRICAKMEAKGARISPEYCDTKIGELTDWTAQARDWLRITYGIENATSSAQVLRALDANDVPYLRKLTATGKQALDKEVFESINHPIGQYVTAVKHMDKMRTSYLENFHELMDSEGRLHPTIWVAGARTGRMSITDPALQTLPRGDALIRGAFIPSDGNVLITIDADQIEARLMAHFSKDEGLVNAFMADGDFFTNLSSTIFNQPIEKKDARRQMIKTFVYSSQYGAGIDKMARIAKVSPESMEAIAAAFNRTYPGVKRFQNEIANLAALRERTETLAYIKTPYGRKMVAEDGKAYTLVNYLIQGHAAEILKRNMASVEAAGLGDYMILPVHDELVLDVPKEHSEDVLHQLETILNDYDNYAVPITWGGEILTSNWGEKYE